MECGYYSPTFLHSNIFILKDATIADPAITWPQRKFKINVTKFVRAEQNSRLECDITDIV